MDITLRQDLTMWEIIKSVKAGETVLSDWERYLDAEDYQELKASFERPVKNRFGSKRCLLSNWQRFIE